jgi:hypothetical protein
MISLRECELTVGQSIGEDLDGATLTFDTLPQPVTIPCTFTPIKKSFQIPIQGGGFSLTTSIGIVVFRTSQLDGFADDSIIKQTLHCILTPIPGAEPMGLQLWHGGLMPGGGLYEFMLVDENFHA